MKVSENQYACIRFFVKVLCHHCIFTMVDFLRRCFVADVNTRQQSFLSFLNLYAFPRLQLQGNSPTFDSFELE